MTSFAISASLLLNKLSPLVAKFKISFTIPVDMPNLTVVLLFSVLNSRKLTMNGVTHTNSGAKIQALSYLGQEAF